MLRLLMVRHGVTIWNAEDRRSGHTDIPLTETGIEQARRVAQRLRNERIDAIWTSDLERAWKTAEIIAEPHQLIPIRTPLLRERCHGQLEGLTRVEIDGKDTVSEAALKNNDHGAEELADVWDRVIMARQHIREKHTNGTVLLVGHYGPMRMLICDAIGVAMDVRGRFRLENASLSTIEYTEDFSYLRLLNDTGHL